MRKPLAAITLSFALLMGATSNSSTSLYDGTSTPSQTPDQQGWSEVNLIPSATQATPSSDGTTFDSGTNLNFAVYHRSSTFTLDRKKGYSVSFSLKVNSESHGDDNSAGFNFTVISNQPSNEKQPYGIELCFWENSIWAKNGLNHGEDTSFNNKGDVNNYTLFVKNENYKLFVNGSASPVLQGRLRQYSLTNPLFTSNSIIMGDDSINATANVLIKSVSAVPVSQYTVTNSSGK